MGPSSGTPRPESGLLIAGRYELQSELGRGGMGSVWLARDRVENRSVAVKFQGVVVEAANDRRFAREADALCRLACPHVVKFYYAGRERGLSFIVMEHLLGHTLRQRLEKSPHLYPQEVSALIWQAAIGLGSAHRAGIVHRDVKPSNLFMTVDGGKDCLKVIDFGIAKGRGLDNSTAGSGAIGSPGYMSPEQALGERVDHRSDVWSLAVVAFTALCGKEPFTADNVPATLERILRGQSRQLTRERPGLPEALDGFFLRAFVQDPLHRFQSTSELAVHFERACQGVALEPLGRLGKTKSIAPSVPGPRLSPVPTPASAQVPRSHSPQEGSGRASAPSYPPGTAPSYPPATAPAYRPTPASYPPAGPAYSATAPAYTAGRGNAPSYPPARAPFYPPLGSAPSGRASAPSLPVVAAPAKHIWMILAAAGLVAMSALLIIWVALRSPASPPAVEPPPPQALVSPSSVAAPAPAPVLAPAPQMDIAQPTPAPSPAVPAPARRSATRAPTAQPESSPAASPAPAPDDGADESDDDNPLGHRFPVRADD